MAFLDVRLTCIIERTKNRPLASGLIPVYGAWALLAVMVCGCFFFLSLVNSTAYVLVVFSTCRDTEGIYSFFVGIFGIFPFHALYPLMKRWTWLPQAWLGMQSTQLLLL